MDTNKHIVQIKNVDKKLYFELSKKFWVTILLIAFSTFYFSAQAQEYLRVYTSAPKVMTSTVAFLGSGSIITEDFESFNNLPNYDWAPSPNGYSSSIGTYLQLDINESYVKNDDQYGAGTGWQNCSTGGFNSRWNKSQERAGAALPRTKHHAVVVVWRAGLDCSWQYNSDRLHSFV